MTKIIYILLAITFLVSCKEEGAEKAEKTKTKTTSEAKKQAVDEEVINPNEKGEVVIEGNLYTEYYAGIGGKIKFQGDQDAEDKRHGKWLYYSINGGELSMTNYVHGVKNGHTIVKYPSGMLHYAGEYKDGKMVGVWRTYSEKGEVKSEKDYGNAE